MNQVVTNEYGEPMGIEYVRDQYEEEEAWCEEMQMRAEDPMYAAQQEDAYWYQLALSCFEEKGIEVPENVVNALKCELRRKEQDRQEEKAMKEVEPILNYLKAHLPKCEWYVNYYNETPDEVAHVEVGCTYRPYKWELAEVMAKADAEGFSEKYGVGLDEYVSESDGQTMVGYLEKGKGYAKYVRNWTAEEYCGQDYLFALRNDWLEREDFTKEEKYLKAIWAIVPVTDCYGNSAYDAFRREYPEEKYTIWFGEIRHNGEYNDTICFHWS
jgi:hypothetical protein